MIMILIMVMDEITKRGQMERRKKRRERERGMNTYNKPFFFFSEICYIHTDNKQQTNINQQTNIKQQ